VRTLIVLYFAFSGFTALAQKYSDALIEARLKYGFLAAHRSIMGHLPTDQARAVEVSYILEPKGKKAWHKAYNYPTYGVTTFFGSVGNNELLGHYLGVIGFANFPFIHRKHYVFSGKLATGLAYTNKIYDPDNNILEVAVSSHINAQICLALENQFTFGNHRISLSIDMTHFSNGASKVPNLGLNLPYASIGYGYRIHKATALEMPQHEAYQKYWEYGLSAFSTTKQVYPSGSRHYYVGGFSLLGRRYFRPKTAMEVSFDVMYNSAIMDVHSDVPRRKDEIIQLGAFTGYVLPLDRFQFLLGMGVYMRDKFVQQERFYHRLGIRYVFPKGINLSVLLKSHWARADYIEYGIGYTFRK
jgi:hypothetical protein